MEINITKEALNVKKVVCEKKEIINIQGDMIVPDSKPDILNTINTSGNVCIYKKEVMEGKIKLDGNILAYIMYLADTNGDASMEMNVDMGEINVDTSADMARDTNMLDDVVSVNDDSSANRNSAMGNSMNKNIRVNNIRGLNTNLDFSETFSMPELESGMNVDISPSIKLIECKVINGRKIGIKATLEIVMKVYSKETVEVITDLNDNNIQVLSKNMRANSLLGEGTTKASIKENISIPNTDNLAEILSAQICLVDKDIKISYNKVLAKSEVEIKMVYLTEEGRICTTQSRVPLVGFIDMPNIKEENTCETSYVTRNMIIKPNSIEEHSVYIEMEVEISCITYEEKEIRIIQDMYCPGQKMNFDTAMVNTIANKQCKKNVCNIREKMNIPEMESGNIVDVMINPIINKENKLNGKIIFEGELELNFIFTDRSTVGINTKKITIPFEQSVDEIDTNNNCKAETTVEVNSQEFLNQTGVVSSNIDLNFETNTYRNLAIPVISNITMEDEENTEDYSVIIYVIKSGDTIWKIAKRFGSTIDDIARVNGMKNPDRINVGEKIYIPKYVLKMAKEPIVISQNV